MKHSSCLLFVTLIQLGAIAGPVANERSDAMERQALAPQALFVNHLVRVAGFFKTLKDLAFLPFQFSTSLTSSGLHFPIPQSPPAPYPYPHATPMPIPPRENEFVIDQARTAQDLDDVFALTYHNYLRKGYATPNPEQMLNHYPAFNRLSTVYVVRQHGKIIGTLSTTRDSAAHGLTFEKDFGKEVDHVRHQHGPNSLLGVWRYIVAPEFANHLVVNSLLIDAVYREVDNAAIEAILFGVNPLHHGPNWQKALDAEIIAEVGSTGSLKNAPEVLLYVTAAKARGSRRARRLERRRHVRPLEAGQSDRRERAAT